MSKNMGKNSSLSNLNKNMGRKTKKKGLKQDKGHKVKRRITRVELHVLRWAFRAVLPASLHGVYQARAQFNLDSCPAILLESIPLEMPKKQFPARESLVSDIPAGDGKSLTYCYSVLYCTRSSPPYSSIVSKLKLLQ
jgi:hypothetical protein